MRQLAVALLSCALFSAVLLAGPASEAHAQGYDASGQAVLDNAQSYIGTPYGAYGMDCSGFTSAVFAATSACTFPTHRTPSTPTGRHPTLKPATSCSSMSMATASRT